MRESSLPLTRAALWLLTGRVVGLAFTAAIPVVLVRHLSVAEFGLYKQVFLLVNSAVTILPLGFAMTAFYFFNAASTDRRAVVANVLLFHTVVLGVTAVVIGGFDRALPALFGTWDLAPHRLTIAGVLLLFGLGGVLDTLLAAAQEFKAAAIFAAASQFSRALALIVGGVLSGTLEGTLIAAAVHAAAQLAFMIGYLHHRYPGFWRCFSPALLRRQLSYGVPLGLAGLVYYTQNDLPQYLVARWFGPGEFAIYAVGSFQLPFVGMVLHAMGSVLIPKMAELQATERHAEVVEVLAAAMRKLAIVYFGLYAFLVPSARDLILLLFTPRYEASVPLFAIQLTLIPLNVVLLDPLLRAYQEHRYFLLRLRIVLLVALVGLLWFGSTTFGLLGAVTAVVAVATAERSILAARLFRALPWSASATTHVRLMLATGAAAVLASAAAYWLTPTAGMSEAWRLVCRGAAFAPVYFALLLSFGVLLEEERRALFSWAQHPLKTIRS